MVKHIVCFKLIDKKDAEEAKKLLLSMQGKVPTVKGIEVGVDELGSARSYDIFLSVLVEDFAALAEYQKDEYHCGVVKKYLNARAENVIALDFEVER